MTSAPTRVLVVDDSVVVRQLVARVLDAEVSTEVAGVAANGRIALEKIARLHPDVVVLDLEMPEMDGFETLAAIRRDDPSLPVIIFSHLTAAGATATLDAAGCRRHRLRAETIRRRDRCRTRPDPRRAAAPGAGRALGRHPERHRSPWRSTDVAPCRHPFAPSSSPSPRVVRTHSPS